MSKIEDTKLIVTINADYVAVVTISPYDPSYVYNIMVDGTETRDYRESYMIVKGEGKHSVSVTAHRRLDSFKGDVLYDIDMYEVGHDAVEFYINVPYSAPANVISLKNNTYDDLDGIEVPFEVWTHPFTVDTKVYNGGTEMNIDEVEKIPHGDYRYTSYTYEGTVDTNTILKSLGKAIQEDGVVEPNDTYKVSDWTYECSDGNHDRPKITEDDMKTNHAEWYEMYNNFVTYDRPWNIENWYNDKFKDLLGYYKYYNPNNNRYYESAYNNKEYRIVDTFLSGLQYANVDNPVPPEILGIDELDETQIALYPGVVRGLNQYYAGWIDGMPFELNDKTELTSGDLCKNSNIRVLTQYMKRNNKKVAVEGGTEERDRDFKIDTVKPQFPQVNIDLESVMRNPFMLMTTKEGTDTDTTYQLRRVVYKYYSDDPNEPYNYEHIIGDSKYELVDFQVGDYIWDDGDYILDVWNYREVNHTFRHRSFYFTINTLKNMDILPLKAKIIPLNASKWQESMDGEMLLDWITGDYYINVDGVVKSATVNLNNDTSELEEVEFQRLVDAADYMDMLEDDIQRYNANKDLIEEAMKEVYRMLELYKEYMRCIDIANSDTKFNRYYIDDVRYKLIALYKEVVVIESYLSELNSAVDRDKKVLANMKRSVDNGMASLSNVANKINLLKGYGPNKDKGEKTGIEMWQDLISDMSEKQAEYVSDKSAYPSNCNNTTDSHSHTKPERSTIDDVDVYYTITFIGGEGTNIVDQYGDDVALSRTVIGGTKYVGTIVPREGYVLNSVQVGNGPITKPDSLGTVRLNVLIDDDITIRIYTSIKELELESGAYNGIKITRNLSNVKYSDHILEQQRTVTNPEVVETNTPLYKFRVNEATGNRVIELDTDYIEGYNYVNLDVVMDGKSLGNRTTIEPVTGDIVITADGTKKRVESVDVNNYLSNCRNTNTRTKIVPGIPYKDSKLVCDADKNILPSVSIVMDGVDITAYAYDFTTGEIYIDNVTGPIDITASAGNPTSYVHMSTKLINVTLDVENPSKLLMMGDSYKAKVVVDDKANYYELYNGDDAKVVVEDDYLNFDNTKHVRWSNAKDIVGKQFEVGKKVRGKYKFTVLKVISGTEDITSRVYNKETNEIYIPVLTNNTAILIAAERPKNVKVYTDLTGVELVTTDSMVLPIRGDFHAKISEDAYIKIVDDMGTDLTGRCYKNGTISISNIEDDIYITAIANGIYTANYDLTHAIVDDLVEGEDIVVLEAGDVYDKQLYAEEGYSIDEVTVVMNGVDITKEVYDKETHSIHIECVKGDIKVTVVCSTIQSVEITANLTRAILSNSNTSILKGAMYQTTIIPNTGMEIGYVQIMTTSGKDITADSYHNGRVRISKLDEDIIIVAIATT